jgi:histidine phosphotransfer protein HptB
MSSSPIDLEHLAQLSEGDRDFEEELLMLYLQDTTEQLTRLKTAAIAQDWQTLHQTAHHIKGASGNVGAPAIADIAAQLEQHTKQGILESTAAITELIAELETAYAIACSYIAELIANPHDRTSPES